MKPANRKSNLSPAVRIGLFFLGLTAQISTSTAQAVLFDFDSIPVHTPLPVSQSVGGITAHLSGTGSGYSIQAANVLGFTPAGFSGNILYPNSIYLSDLLISFDRTISDFSIMYACQELACDDAATMRVTAYLAGSFAGTNTKMTAHPGTWPVDTLRCSFPGFDSVVVHYDHIPPTCRDYGVIYLADNMLVTPVANTRILNPEMSIEKLVIPNPVSGPTVLSFSLLLSQHIRITVYDITGRLIRDVFEGYLNAGGHNINWDVSNDVHSSGLYILKLCGETFSVSSKLVVVK